MIEIETETEIEIEIERVIGVEEIRLQNGATAAGTLSDRPAAPGIIAYTLAHCVVSLALFH